MVSSLVRGYTWSGSEGNESGAKVGVVSIWRIFQESKRITRYRQEALAEKQRMQARLEQLSREIEAEKAGLRTVRAGSSDYLKQRRVIFEKQAALEVEQELYKEQMTSREQNVTKELYKDILQATREAAEEKGLRLVFERSEPELETLNPTQLEFAMGTHKLLYSEGCWDITEEVLTLVDGKKREKESARRTRP
jgi:Skp family chaperone for outer membrane proteins